MRMHKCHGVCVYNFQVFKDMCIPGIKFRLSGLGAKCPYPMNNLIDPRYLCQKEAQKWAWWHKTIISTLKAEAG